MSGRISYYGGIVRNGLVLHLDAGKKDSYPRTGTLWGDLSGNGNNGTLTNFGSQTIWNGDNGGAIVFDGTNDYVSIPSFNFGSNAFSISYWLYKLDRTYKYVQDLGGNNTGALALGPGTGGQLTTNAAINVYGGSKILSIGTELGSSWYPINQFFEITITRNGSVSSLYLNGNLIYTDTASGTFGGNSTSKICAYGVGSFNFNGRVSTTKFYNRLLTSSEVLQNYNALKGRFNL
jgi:hypothetical protein